MLQLYIELICAVSLCARLFSCANESIVRLQLMQLSEESPADH